MITRNMELAPRASPPKCLRWAGKHSFRNIKTESFWMWGLQISTI